MSTISTTATGKCIVSVKGAPETIKSMLAEVPDHYDATYKHFTRRGSRVLALGWKQLEGVPMDKVRIFFAISVPLSKLRADIQAHS